MYNRMLFVCQTRSNMKRCVLSILYLYYFHIEILGAEANLCCPPTETITSMTTCSNGSQITTISCKEREFMFSTEERALLYEIDEDEVLSVTQDEDLGFLVVNPDNYCLGISAQNETDLILVCINSEADDDAPISVEYYALRYTSMICAFISVLCFGGVAFIYLYLPELRDIEGKCIIHFSISLAICHFCQCIGPIIIDYNESTCDMFSFMNNFVLLCGYNWLTVMSIHIWRITIRPIFRTKMNWFLIYFFYGYGLPTILLITSLISHLTNQDELQRSIQLQAENHQCWLESSVIVWFYFYGPLAIFVFISTFTQLWAAKILWIDIYRADMPSVVYLRKKAQMYLHTLVVMGTLVVLELALFKLHSTASYGGRLALAIIDCRNLLIGGAVFLIFVGLRNKVLKALAKNGMCCCTFPVKWKKLIDEEVDERDAENDETRLTRPHTRF